MRALLIALPLLTLANVGGVTKDLEARRLDHPWGRWQPGAWVRTESTSSALEGSSLIEREQLLRGTDDVYVLKSGLQSASGDVETEAEFSWAMGGYAFALHDAELIGTEPVTVDGRARECEVWQGEWELEGETIIERTWVCEDFPFPVRSVTRGGGVSLDVGIVKGRDYVQVGDRKLACTRLVGTGNLRGSPIEMTLWMSAHVPGGMARREVRAKTSEGTRLVIKQALEFHGEAARPR